MRARPSCSAEPGVLAGPYPSVDLVLVAGIEHVAAAWAHRPDSPPGRTWKQNFDAWLRDRLRTAPDQKQEPADQQPADNEPDEGPVGERIGRPNR